MPRVSLLVLRTFALALLVAPLEAQERAARPLGPPVAELKEVWSGTLQLLELRGG